MVESVALGERAREPVLRQRPAVEQHSLGHRARTARGLDRILHLLARDEAHFDDHVGEKAWRGSPAGGSGDAGPLPALRGALDLHRRIFLPGSLNLDGAVEPHDQSILRAVLDLNDMIELYIQSVLRATIDLYIYGPLELHGVFRLEDLIGVDAEDRVQVWTDALRNVAHSRRVFVVGGRPGRGARPPPAIEACRSGPVR